MWNLLQEFKLNFLLLVLKIEKLKLENTQSFDKIDALQIEIDAIDNPRLLGKFKG